MKQQTHTQRELQQRNRIETVSKNTSEELKSVLLALTLTLPSNAARNYKLGGL